MEVAELNANYTKLNELKCSVISFVCSESYRIHKSLTNLKE